MKDVRKKMGMTCGMTVLGLVASVGAAVAPLESATPESQGVSSEGVLRWIDACEKSFNAGESGALHGFVILRHGKVVAEGSWKPFDTLNETHMLYSHSKSFTSSAIGFLADEGKIDLDERVCAVFSNEVPVTVSENLAQLRVRDLLTMNAGKRDHLLREGGDWVRKFLSEDFAIAPGTAFRYDSDATYMLAALVERRAGMKLMDYLKVKMFDRIGIATAWTTTSPQGIACGGWGMNMTTREMARFGQLYLNRGMWGDVCVLSPFWVDLATARHTWSGWQNVGVKALGEGSDWEQGYGFQFWRCRHGAYRADGADGQCTVVMPEQDAVVCISAGLSNMQLELNLVWEHLLPAMADDPLPENAESARRLQERLAKLEIAPVAGTLEASDAFWLRKYEFKDNPRGFKSVEFVPGADAQVVCKLVTRSGEQEFVAGNQTWTKGCRVRIDPEGFEALGAYVGEHVVAASAGLCPDGKFRVKAYLTGATGYLEFIAEKGGKMTGRFWAMGGCMLETK